MKNNVFRELAWFEIKETLKPMPGWWPVWVWFLILFFPITVIAIGLICYFTSESKAVGELCILMSMFCSLVTLAAVTTNSFYIYYIQKYKCEYKDLKTSYPLYTERDFYLKVKSFLAKKWEQEKEERIRHELERSNQIKKQYDI